MAGCEGGSSHLGAFACMFALHIFMYLHIRVRDYYYRMRRGRLKGRRHLQLERWCMILMMKTRWMRGKRLHSTSLTLIRWVLVCMFVLSLSLSLSRSLFLSFLSLSLCLSLFRFRSRSRLALTLALVSVSVSVFVTVPASVSVPASICASVSVPCQHCHVTLTCPPVHRRLKAVVADK